MSMQDHTPVVTGVHSAGSWFTWSWKRCGFGEMSFYYNQTTQKWGCDTEGMGPESTRKLLHALADYIADQLEPAIEEERQASLKHREKVIEEGKRQAAEAAQTNQASNEGETPDPGAGPEGIDPSA